MVVVGGYLALKLLRLRSDPTGFDHWSKGIGQKGLTSRREVFGGDGGLGRAAGPQPLRPGSDLTTVSQLVKRV